MRELRFPEQCAHIYQSSTHVDSIIGFFAPTWFFGWTEFLFWLELNYFRLELNSFRLDLIKFRFQSGSLFSAGRGGRPPLPTGGTSRGAAPPWARKFLHFRLPRWPSQATRGPKLAHFGPQKISPIGLELIHFWLDLNFCGLDFFGPGFDLSAKLPTSKITHFWPFFALFIPRKWPECPILVDFSPIFAREWRSS